MKFCSIWYGIRLLSHLLQQNTLFSLCYFNVDFCNKYACLQCVAKLFCFSIHVQDDKVFVCDTDSKRKNGLNTQVKEHHRRNIVFDSPEKQITQNATHKIMRSRVPIRRVANLGICKHLKVTRETTEV